MTFLQKKVLFAKKSHFTKKGQFFGKFWKNYLFLQIDIFAKKVLLQKKANFSEKNGWGPFSYQVFWSKRWRDGGFFSDVISGWPLTSLGSLPRNESALFFRVKRVRVYDDWLRLVETLEYALHVHGFQCEMEHPRGPILNWLAFQLSDFV